MTEQIRRSFSIAEISQRNNIGRSTIYEQIAAGRLIARKVGARTIITDEDESDWLTSLPKSKPHQLTQSAA
jgi:excisionase family DNA binding protein